MLAIKVTEPVDPENKIRIRLLATLENYNISIRLNIVLNDQKNFFI